MISLTQLEEDLKQAIKNRNQEMVDALRALKTRIQNEKIAKLGAAEGREISLEDLVALVRSEIKKRKESAEAFQKGSRPEMAEKELKEVVILEAYLPAQMPESEIVKIINELLENNAYTSKDFGKAMGELKTKAGQAADGATLAKLLKEKLK